MPSRAEPVYKAKMAEQAERYDQMTNFVDQFAKFEKKHEIRYESLNVCQNLLINLNLVFSTKILIL